MAQNITSDVRTTAVFTESAHYFFNIGGTWGGASISLEWSEDRVDWYPIKDANDIDIIRTDDSNGIVSVGKVGWLSVLPSSTSGTTDLNLSLIPV
jgi:hypothetical protein